MFRASSITDTLYDESYKILLEDYALWLKSIFDLDLKYANIGQILIKHRKHGTNTSKRVNEINLAESKLKALYLSKLTSKEISTEVAQEFVLITNRALKGPLYTKAMSGLKFKKELIQLFDALKIYY